MPEPVILTTSSSLFVPARQGKVRDLYDLGDELLIAATDRLSAFDVVLPDGIPFKGKVLTQISSFWFQRLSSIVPTHLLSTRLEDFPEPFRSAPETFAGRSMLVRATKPLPVECIARGYLTGSGWKEYQESGGVCGIRLPSGLRESEQLPEPIFTPTTKADVGVHDESITFAQMEKMVGAQVAARVRDLTLALYVEGARYAAGRGIIIADTKFEFGLDSSGSVVWIDEALTPDSSRFWPKEGYAPGRSQPSYDKQFVRDYLVSVAWNKRPPAPSLPPGVIATTSMKYVEALEQLTGQTVR